MMKKETKEIVRNMAFSVSAVILGMFAYKGVNVLISKVKMPKMIATNVAPPAEAPKE